VCQGGWACAAQPCVQMLRGCTRVVGWLGGVAQPCAQPPGACADVRIWLGMCSLCGCVLLIGCCAAWSPGLEHRCSKQQLGVVRGPMGRPWQALQPRCRGELGRVDVHTCPGWAATALGSGASQQACWRHGLFCSSAPLTHRAQQPLHRHPSPSTYRPSPIAHAGAQKPLHRHPSPSTHRPSLTQVLSSPSTVTHHLSPSPPPIAHAGEAGHARGSWPGARGLIRNEDGDADPVSRRWGDHPGD